MDDDDDEEYTTDVPVSDPVEHQREAEEKAEKDSQTESGINSGYRYPLSTPSQASLSIMAQGTWPTSLLST